MEKYFDSRLNLEHRKGAAAVWRCIASDIVTKVGVVPGAALDLGAGYGDFINGVQAREKWAADQWPGMINTLEKGVRGVTGDIREDLPEIPKAHFDLCFMSNVLEHFVIEDAAKVLNVAAGYLKPGGTLALLQPNFTYCSRTYFDDYTHKTIFTAEGLSNFLQDHGFRLKQVRPRYLPFSFKSRLPRPPWMVKMYLASPIKPMAAQMLLLAEKTRDI